MSTTIRNFPATYPDLIRFLDGRDSRTLCNNTTVERRLADGSDTEHILWVKLHGHHIATLWEDGAVFVRDAGYRTVTTKQRLNALLQPHGVSIYQHDYEWHIRERKSDRRFLWFGDMIVPFPYSDGTPYGSESLEVGR